MILLGWGLLIPSVLLALWVLLVIAGALKVLALRLFSRLARPCRKGDAPHDEVRLTAAEEAVYAAMTADPPQPRYSQRREPQ